MNVARLLPAAVFLLVLPGCEAIGNIFKAGVWTGVIVVIAIIAVVGYLLSRLFR